MIPVFKTLPPFLFVRLKLFEGKMRKRGSVRVSRPKALWPLTRLAAIGQMSFISHGGRDTAITVRRVLNRRPFPTVMRGREAKHPDCQSVQTSYCTMLSILHAETQLERLDYLTGTYDLPSGQPTQYGLSVQTSEIYMPLSTLSICGVDSLIKATITTNLQSPLWPLNGGRCQRKQRVRQTSHGEG